MSFLRRAILQLFQWLPCSTGAKTSERCRCAHRFVNGWTRTNLVPPPRPPEYHYYRAYHVTITCSTRAVPADLESRSRGCRTVNKNTWTNNNNNNDKNSRSTAAGSGSTRRRRAAAVSVSEKTTAAQSRSGVVVVIIIIINNNSTVVRHWRCTDKCENVVVRR